MKLFLPSRKGGKTARFLCNGGRTHSPAQSLLWKVAATNSSPCSVTGKLADGMCSDVKLGFVGTLLINRKLSNREFTVEI